MALVPGFHFTSRRRCKDPSLAKMPARSASDRASRLMFDSHKLFKLNDVSMKAEQLDMAKRRRQTRSVGAMM